MFLFSYFITHFSKGTIYVLIERIIIVYKSDLKILAVNYLEKSLQIDERLLHYYLQEQQHCL